MYAHEISMFVQKMHFCSSYTLVSVGGEAKLTFHNSTRLFGLFTNRCKFACEAAVLCFRAFMGTSENTLVINHKLRVGLKMRLQRKKNITFKK